MLRNADVSVIASRDAKNNPIVLANINGHEHRFDAGSRVSKALDIMSPNDIAARLSGGQYFFVEDMLVDFRDGQYGGFVHTDESITHLNDVLGIMESTSRSLSVHENQTNNSIVLGKKWSDHGIEVPGYNDGGDFTSELHFGWNPFVKTINSAFMLYRLICLNGMRGLRSFMNTRIPLVNRWEEHLEIANRQIQNKVESMVSTRLSQMGSERATVAETLLLASHAAARTENEQNRNSSKTIRSLNRISDIVSPQMHLNTVYKNEVFSDKRLAAQMPAHISVFDLYNMTTEVRSHSHEADNSSDRALDKLSNDLVFDRKDLTQHASRFVQPKLSQFSDPDAAFYGEMH